MVSEVSLRWRRKLMVSEVSLHWETDVDGE